MTLRLKIVLVCAGVTALVVTVMGLAIVRSVSDDLRRGLDDDIREVSENFTAPVVQSVV